MTSEFAVLNKTAVALAADSKVTTGRSGREKTYDTANKLFTLSKHHPIGIMINGNAEFMHYPWETIIKIYRKEHGSTELATVREYVEHFLQYLPRFLNYTDLDVDRNVIAICSSELLKIRERAFSKIMHHGATGKRPIRQIVTDCVGEYYEYYEAKPELSLRLQLSVSGFGRRYGSKIDEMIADLFSDFAPATTKRLLKQCCFLILTKQVFSDLHSEIVIAGFGDTERFPSLISYNIDGIVNDRLKIQQSHDIDISREMTGAIVPFAQDDLGFRFIEGIDEKLLEYLKSSVTRLFVSNALSIVDNHVPGTDSDKQELKKAIFKELFVNLQEFKKKMDEYRKENYVNKILDTIIILPKEELANLAESLVGITALVRRVSADVESVGGPIDVAIISKGDGFVWIKRKHYFAPELNPLFLQNYLRT